jgi:hypothetical protein
MSILKRAETYALNPDSGEDVAELLQDLVAALHDCMQQYNMQTRMANYWRGGYLLLYQENCTFRKRINQEQQHYATHCNNPTDAHYSAWQQARNQLAETL